MSHVSLGMELKHYTAMPLEFDPERTYEQNSPRLYGKPLGFWVSVKGEYDWKSWCESEDFLTESLVYENAVVLRDDANILRINSVKGLHQFSTKYGIPETKSVPGYDPWVEYAINWARVAREYDGIIISPYLYSWDLGDDLKWYYGWDCASGCIWRLQCIEEVLTGESVRLTEMSEQ